MNVTGKRLKKASWRAFCLGFRACASHFRAFAPGKTIRRRLDAGAGQMIALATL
jgi:hypothetical protein